VTGLLGCIATVTSNEVVATWVQENYEPTAVTSKGPITVVAEPLYVVWHESDTSLHPESDASSLLAAMAMTMPASTSSPTPTPTPVPSDTPSNVSSGAVAGIVVGFVICLIAMATLGYFAFIRRRGTRTAQSKTIEPGESPGGAQAWSERAIYSGPLQLETPDTTHKTPSLIELHRAESAGLRTPQTPNTPQMMSRAKEEEMIAVEQKMLIR
jgi:hypothetical protein